MLQAPLRLPICTGAVARFYAVESSLCSLLDIIHQDLTFGTSAALALLASSTLDLYQVIPFFHKGQLASTYIHVISDSAANTV